MKRLCEAKKKELDAVDAQLASAPGACATREWHQTSLDEISEGLQKLVQAAAKDRARQLDALIEQLNEQGRIAKSTGRLDMRTKEGKLLAKAENLRAMAKGIAVGNKYGIDLLKSATGTPEQREEAKRDLARTGAKDGGKHLFTKIVERGLGKEAVALLAKLDAPVEFAKIVLEPVNSGQPPRPRIRRNRAIITDPYGRDPDGIEIFKRHETTYEVLERKREALDEIQLLHEIWGIEVEGDITPKEIEELEANLREQFLRHEREEIARLEKTRQEADTRDSRARLPPGTWEDPTAPVEPWGKPFPKEDSGTVDSPQLNPMP